MTSAGRPRSVGLRPLAGLLAGLSWLMAGCGAPEPTNDPPSAQEPDPDQFPEMSEVCGSASAVSPASNEILDDWDGDGRAVYICYEDEGGGGWAAPQQVSPPSDPLMTLRARFSPDGPVAGCFVIQTETATRITDGETVYSVPDVGCDMTSSP